MPDETKSRAGSFGAKIAQAAATDAGGRIRPFGIRTGARTLLNATGNPLAILRPGNAAACRSAAIAGFTASQTQHLHVGCARHGRKRPKSAHKSLKSLPKPSPTSLGGNAGEDRPS